MKLSTVAFAFGTAVMLCNPGTFSAAQARKAMHAPRERVYVTPMVTPTPYWDSYIVPRYRYRPQDDRVAPYGPPVVPVIRYGDQEETVPMWNW